MHKKVLAVSCALTFLGFLSLFAGISTEEAWILSGQTGDYGKIFFLEAVGLLLMAQGPIVAAIDARREERAFKIKAEIRGHIVRKVNRMYPAASLEKKQELYRAILESLRNEKDLYGIHEAIDCWEEENGKNAHTSQPGGMAG